MTRPPRLEKDPIIVPIRAANGVDETELHHLIRHFRNVRKMTLQELAEHVGVSSKMLSMIELNQRRPSLETFLEILDALGLDFVIKV